MDRFGSFLGMENQIERGYIIKIIVLMLIIVAALTAMFIFAGAPIPFTFGLSVGVTMVWIGIPAMLILDCMDDN